MKRSAKEDRRKWLKERATTAKKAKENGRNKELSSESDSKHI